MEGGEAQNDEEKATMQQAQHPRPRKERPGEISPLTKPRARTGPVGWIARKAKNVAAAAETEGHSVTREPFSFELDRQSANISPQCRGTSESSHDTRQDSPHAGRSHTRTEAEIGHVLGSPISISASAQHPERASPGPAISQPNEKTDSVLHSTLQDSVKSRTEIIEKTIAAQVPPVGQKPYKAAIAAAMPNLLAAVAKLSRDEDENEDHSADMARRSRSSTPEWLTPAEHKGKDRVPSHDPEIRMCPPESRAREVTRAELIANVPDGVLKRWQEHSPE